MIDIGQGENPHASEEGRYPIYLTDEARRQGVYVIGTTGTGKTTLLTSMVIQDMNDPKRPGLCVLDPHGDMIDTLLRYVPRHRKNDVILFAPGDREDQYHYPLGLNILACEDDPHEKELVASTVVSTLYKLYSYSWGPRMEDVLRNGILTLMEGKNSTLLDLWKFLIEQSQRDKKHDHNPLAVKDKFQDKVWNKLFLGYERKDKAEIVGSSLNKIGRFLSNPMIRTVVGQKRTAFDLPAMMKSGGILLCNLSKGDLGEDNSSLLGSVIVNLILIAALRRRSIPEHDRRPFHLIVDEFQNFATESFPTLQSEARKYGITVTVAHQYRDQLDDLNKGSSMNCANFICLRVSGRDSLELANQFDNTPQQEVKWEEAKFRHTDPRYQEFYYADPKIMRPIMAYQRTYSDMAGERANKLANLPNYHALCRLLVNNRLEEYTVEITNKVEPREAEQPTVTRERNNIAYAIRKHSREKHGQDRRVVEEEIAVTLENWAKPSLNDKDKDAPSSR